MKGKSSTDMQRMNRVLLLPNVVTAFGLTCGLFVIFKTSMLEVGDSFETMQMSALLLLLAAVADVLDGAIARATSGESEFGGHFDSLSDAIVFGVAPSVLMLKALSLDPGSKTSFLATSGAMVYCVCGVLRLVRYNTQASRAKADPQNLLASGKGYFVGLPIPAAAGVAVATNLFLVSPECKALFTVSRAAHSLSLTAVMFFLGYLMLSRWRFPSVKSLQLRVPSFRGVFVTVVAAVMTFFGLIYHFPVVLLVATWGYVVAAWSVALYRRFVGGSVAEKLGFEEDDEIQ